MKILCIGRNYIDHAKELNNPVPSEPVIFGKPDSAILPNGQDFYIPEFSSEIHHELELVVRICKHGKHIQPKFAKKYYDRVTVGIDFTARDLQSKLKSKGLPWEISKGFDGSAIVGDFVGIDELETDIQNTDIRLTVNGETAQHGNTSEMIFQVDDLISHLSTYYTLRQGDLIFTGTPAGVAAVKQGDCLEGFINNRSTFKVDVK
ncbi:MAG: FAA hydrolase family protein [Bacteroidetes bacterium]|uniref:Fumarylacetoacetate hydrolase family protein n=1 Tax=Phaeocystidibacter marisrubri TaxID=1577780 RepID=A0A6L3ZI05_9FLAO|nr:fumarylacetoacetate hydrolase family protein [Phaeocystidibacter marisrubri]KAB2817491.1 fumarylacetoacetate hydrolase family protein [Phaeocystidibacter marisrubri]TNE28706.1 MAG: FAA hydrolase family protein [Bacteroidota bacterium]GGH75077.1 2-hydroxyhepta-2,4-diene-1,7-dioate isomerase [Phaeocystidibacter marisrubri]